MNITEGLITIALVTAIGWPAVSYTSKAFDKLSNMSGEGLTEMVLENQCAQVDQRYIDVSELGKQTSKQTSKKKPKPSATNLCGLE